MSLNEIMILRVNDGLKKQLVDLALKSGVSASAIARNSIAIAIMPPEKPSLIEEILKKVRLERETELYGRSEKEQDNGKRE